MSASCSGSIVGGALESPGTKGREPASDSLEFRLLNEFQRNFPLSLEPFREIGERLGCGESAVLSILRRLQGEGTVSRIGAVFAPGSVGASTLAALAVAPGRVEDVARLVSAHPEVNHNYEREHAFNLWFVVTGRSQAQVADCLAAIETECGVEPISVPLEEEFHIDLGFDLSSATGSRQEAGPRQRRREELTESDRRLIGALQDGLDLVPRPYSRLAMRAGMSESDVLERLASWVGTGVIKRFGVVVRHRSVGYAANAMCVWDVPDEAVGALARALAREPAISLCYRRRRSPPRWCYNLYCMIHGRSRGEAESRLAEIRERHGLDGYPGAVLFSRRCFKQCGARYVARAERAHG